METFDEIVKQVQTLDGVKLLAVVLAIFSYILKKVEKFPNWLGWVIVPGVGAALGPLFSGTADVDISFAANPLAVKSAHGFIHGFAAWILGAYLLDLLISKLPGGKPPTP